MNHKAWDDLYLCLIQQQEVFEKIELETLNLDNLTEQANDFSPFITELETIFSACQTAISQHLDEAELTYVVEALIFQCDETILTQKLVTKTCESQHAETLNHLPFLPCSKWVTLQKHLLDCRTGGERFFENLEQILATENKYPFALEVYYFCLKQGFVGRYNQQSEPITEYMRHCTKAISQSTEVLKHPHIHLKQHERNEPLLRGQHGR
ncbi:DotU family type IV/VI secretion system protein [Paraglaciecola marina]|uniref:DotU family type IV/VI secretion system protein n=1 Tax=Paraglaciecola marina TaxID=2500157 RepID=UPI00105E2E30|nr:DotU family type IV/VI secretion system protein [Paraglaciecola marina]